jgi:putative transposase
MALGQRAALHGAGDARDFGEKLDLLIHTTPSHSPKSNGMAESFMKTSNRDYVYVNELLGATNVI